MLRRGRWGVGSVMRPPLVAGRYAAFAGTVPDNVRLLNTVSGVPVPRPDTLELARMRPFAASDMLDRVVPSPMGDGVKLPLLRRNSGGNTGEPSLLREMLRLFELLNVGGRLGDEAASPLYVVAGVRKLDMFTISASNEPFVIPKDNTWPSV